MYCWVWSRRNPLVLDFTCEKSLWLAAKGAKWKFKCLVGVAHLPVPAHCKVILKRIKSWANELESNMVQNQPQNCCSHKFHILIILENAVHCGASLSEQLKSVVGFLQLLKTVLFL